MDKIIDGIGISLCGMKVAVYLDSNDLCISAYKEGDRREGECLFNLTDLSFVPEQIHSLLKSSTVDLKFRKNLVKTIVIGAYAKKYLTDIEAMDTVALVEHKAMLHSCFGKTLKPADVKQACAEYIDLMEYAFASDALLSFLDTHYIKAYFTKNRPGIVIQKCMRAMAYTIECQEAQRIKEANIDVI